MALWRTERSNAHKSNLSRDEGTKGLREGGPSFQAILQSSSRALRVFGGVADDETKASPIEASVSEYHAGTVRFGTSLSMRGISPRDVMDACNMTDLV